MQLNILGIHNYLTVKVKSNIFIAFLFAICALFSACYEPQKSCLDINATNFDAAADAPCSDGCCVYPKLLLTVNYKFDTFRLDTAKYYATSRGDSVKINQIRFFISDIRLLNNSNTQQRIKDSALIRRATDSSYSINDFLIIGRNSASSFNYSVGTLGTLGNYSQLQFRVGLLPNIAATDASRMPSDSPLSIQADSMYLKTNQQYICLQVNFQSKTRKYNLNWLNNEKEITITKTYVFKNGFDATIPMTINYKPLFNDINLTTDTENTILAKCVMNLDKIFQF